MFCRDWWRRKLEWCQFQCHFCSPIQIPGGQYTKDEGKFTGRRHSESHSWNRINSNAERGQIRVKAGSFPLMHLLMAEKRYINRMEWHRGVSQGYAYSERLSSRTWKGILRNRRKDAGRHFCMLCVAGSDLKIQHLPCNLGVQTKRKERDLEDPTNGRFQLPVRLRPLPRTSKVSGAFVSEWRRSRKNGEYYANEIPKSESSWCWRDPSILSSRLSLKVTQKRRSFQSETVNAGLRKRRKRSTRNSSIKIKL